MITIDQLLESVDLDFEPRWVTKDENGDVYIFEDVPETYEQSKQWATTVPASGLAGYEGLKLSEFDSKDWTECIYEVPKKVDYTKLVGKLCWFWDEECNTKNIVGFLTRVDLEAQHPFCINNSDCWENCEPVLPDDSVIYKGE